MQTVHNIAGLRALVDQWRSRRERVAFVPTMGNLHAGHMHLVKQAAGAGDRVVVSIFVNPMQFGPSEDYAAYPRTLKADSLKLAENGVHLLFVPDMAELYPNGVEATTRVEVPGLSDILCGAERPGHFTGVATVVAKLFSAVRPHVALFGEKDYQQLLVVQRLAEDLCMPVEVMGVPTVRESDGLALSSRNGYLSLEQRAVAPLLHNVLQHARQRLVGGDHDFAAVEADCVAALGEGGYTPDYVSIRRSEDLGLPQATDTALRILAAAWLGKARLIDNLPITLK